MNGHSKINRWAIASMILGIAIVPLAVTMREEAPARAMRKLAAAIEDERPVEVRLSGLEWARYEPRRTRGREEPNLERSKLVVAAAEAMLAVRDDRTSEGRHTAAVAQLLGGDLTPAIAAMEELRRETPKHAHLVSDAAAAYLVSAMERDRASDLSRALAVVEEALRIDEHLPAALFNRALILEKLGLSRHALSAWHRFLTEEGSGPWADEARTRSSAIRHATLAESFRRSTAALESAAARGNREAVRSIVDAHRQEARASAEGEILGRWAEAEQRGNGAAASRALATAGEIAAALQSINGEGLLAAAVEAINRADASTRARLAQGHADYHRGRMLLGNEKPTEAEPLLIRAAEQFKSARSPMAFVARYFLANTLAVTQRRLESRRILEELVTEIPGDRYRALYAQLHWDLGLTAVVVGDWTGAEKAYALAAAEFASLGEVGNLGFIYSLQAEIADYLGDRDDAWRRLVAAFPLLTRSGRGNRLQVAIGSAARAELRAGSFQRALPLFDLEIAEAAFGASGGSARLASAFARRALLHAEHGDLGSAQRDLREARNRMVALPDPKSRLVVEGTIALSEAMTVVRSRPAAALPLLQVAMNTSVATNQRLPLPRIQLERARALRQLNDEDAALRAYLEGLDELERQRRTVDDLDKRVGVFDAGKALLAESIDLLLRMDDAESAFTGAERARARTVFETTALRTARVDPMSLADIRNSLPPSTVLVEYAVLPARLAIFVVSREGLDVATVNVAEGDLRGAMERFARAVRGRAPLAEVEDVASKTFDLLLRPVDAQTRFAKTIIFVPDRFLQTVPFAALRREGQYLIEDQAVAVAPSASVFAMLSKSWRAVAKGDALVFGNPSTSGAHEDLQGSEAEAQEVAAVYVRPLIAVRGQATREVFFASFGQTAVVHFAGHATTDPARGAAASLAFSRPGGADYVYAYEIARAVTEATSLVVLAACDTFAGTREHVEGTPTLAHAFLAAGVPTVVATLWPIEDESSRSLFSAFHRAYRSGADAAESLREAQVALLHSSKPEVRHPATWSAAEVVGTPSRVSHVKERRPRS